MPKSNYNKMGDELKKSMKKSTQKADAKGKQE